MYQLMPLSRVINDLEQGAEVNQSVIMRYLYELQERHGQICVNCRSYIEGCCDTPMGLMGACPQDYCSRFRAKQQHNATTEE